MTSVEQQIQAHVVDRGIDLKEAFADFDRLRSGYVTASQCRRILDAVGVALDDATTQALASAYADRGDGRVNYVALCRTVSQSAVKPAQTPAQTPDASADLVNAVFDRVLRYVAFRQDAAKDWFTDYDRNNEGTVSASRFRRAFPFSLSEAEFAALVGRYGSRVNGAVLCNYLRFSADVTAMQNRVPEYAAAATLRAAPSSRGTPPAPAVDVARVVSRLQKHVFTQRIRVADPFADRDPLHHGTVTTPQFKSALGTLRFRLSPTEMDALAAAYAAPDPPLATGALVAYPRFVADVDAVFTTARLDRSPQTVVAAPSYDYIRQSNDVPPEVQAHVDRVVAFMAAIVAKRRMNILPFFEAHDRHSRGLVTQSQFHRTLAAMGLDVPQSDIIVLLEKYADPASPTYDVRYFPFIRAIDPEGVFESSTLFNAASQAAATAALTAAHGEHQLRTQAAIAAARPVSDAQIDALVRDLQFAVLAKRLRPRDFFADFDRLRHGHITASQFRRGVALIAGDCTRFDDAQAAALAARFAHPRGDGTVDYDAFCQTLDSVFTSDAILSPGARALPLEVDSVLAVPAPASNVTAIVARMATYVHQRGLLVRPWFEDFDRHHRGYVTRKNALQALVNLGIACSPDEFAAVADHYADERGDVAYGQLVDALEQQPTETATREMDHAAAATRAAGAGIRIDNGGAVLAPYDAPQDVNLELLLTKIRNTVATRRIRLKEFMSEQRYYDGTMPAHRFYSALAMAGVHLVEAELEALGTRFSASPPGATTEPYVNHRAFLATVEKGIHEKGMERRPRDAPCRYVPVHTQPVASLSDADDAAFRAAMARMAHLVRTRRMLLKPAFQDSDRHNHGKITAAKFAAVLEGCFQLAQDEIKSVIAVFGTEDGYCNYVAFLDSLEWGAHNDHLH